MSIFFLCKFIRKIGLSKEFLPFSTFIHFFFYFNPRTILGRLLVEIESFVFFLSFSRSMILPKNGKNQFFEWSGSKSKVGSQFWKDRQRGLKLEFENIRRSQIQIAEISEDTRRGFRNAMQLRGVVARNEISDRELAREQLILVSQRS